LSLYNKITFTQSAFVGLVNARNLEHNSGDKIEKNEMGGAYSAYGVEERRIQGFGGET